MLQKAPIDVCIPSKTEISPAFLDQIQHDISGVILTDSSTPLTSARMRLIEQVRTPYFAFLDDDIQYIDGLLRTLYNAVTCYEYVGAVQGRTVPYGLGERWDTALRPVHNHARIISPNDHARFMTSNAVIKTGLVRDWTPKPSYSGCEDWHLTRHIQRQDYFIVVLPLNVPHHRTWKKVRDNMSWFSKAYIAIFGTKRGKQYLTRQVLSFGKYLMTLPLHPRLSIYTMYQNMCGVNAFLRNLT